MVVVTGKRKKKSFPFYCCPFPSCFPSVLMSLSCLHEPVMSSWACHRWTKKETWSRLPNDNTKVSIRKNYPIDLEKYKFKPHCAPWRQLRWVCSKTWIKERMKDLLQWSCDDGINAWSCASVSWRCREGKVMRCVFFFSCCSLCLSLLSFFVCPP